MTTRPPKAPRDNRGRALYWLTWPTLAGLVLLVITTWALLNYISSARSLATLEQEVRQDQLVEAQGREDTSSPRMTPARPHASSSAEQAVARRAQERAFAVATGAAALAGLLLVIAGIWLHRRFVQPLAAATRALQRIGVGDTSTGVRTGGPKELRALLENVEGARKYLDARSTAAESIAAGEFDATVELASERDSLGRAIQKINRYLGEVARAANRMSEGDLTTRVQPRNARDAFGTTFQNLAVSLSSQLEDLRTSEKRNRDLADSLVGARSRLEHMLSSSPAMIYSRAASGYADFTFISANVRRELGYDPGEFLHGDFWRDRVHPEDLPAAEGQIERGRTAGGANLEYRFKHADGEYRWMQDGFRVIGDGTESPMELIGWWIDVSEQKASERALNEIETRLQQTQKMEAIGTLAGGIAHDFNNLLTAIRGGSDLLAESLAGSPLLEEVTEIGTAADRAAALTRQLLAFSRKQILTLETVDVGGVVKSMHGLLERLLRGDGVQVSTIPASEPCIVKVDRVQLEQVIMNLVVNARDAMPNGGTVKISYSPVDIDDAMTALPTLAPGPYVMLAVADTGIGMDAETAGRIFEPFFTTKPSGKGTGLGLSTAYGIVRQSGGDIAVVSEPGRGTTFSVYLPRFRDTSELVAPAVTPARAEMSDPSGNELILIVDDEDGVRSLVRRALHRRGYSVLEARSSGEALELLALHGAKVDLLLTDVAMPGMSGRDLAACVSESWPAIAILISSGHFARDPEAPDGTEPVNYAFLEKPFSVDQLTTKIRAVLAASKHATRAP